MKPDWKDAPEWANWLAMDADGVWYWYENEPTPNDFRRVWAEYFGKAEIAIKEWSETLEKRP